MQSDRPLLTIAIPTYNRSGNLDLLLRLLAPQLEGEDRVELVISDNCSPDDTSQIVESYVQRGLRCRYLRNETNIGPDRNFFQCYGMASGRYLWLFGDDDVVLPGSLATILGYIEDRDFDLVYLEPVGFVHEPTERGLVNPHPKARTYETVSGFVHAVGLKGDLALITAILLNKERVEAFPHPPLTDASNTLVPQLSWVFSALKNFRTGLVVDRGLYAVCELNPSRPFDVAEVFGVRWHELAMHYLEPGSVAQNAVLNDQLYSWFPTNWYAQRKTAKKTQTAPPHTLMKPLYGDRLLYWLCVYPLMTWPTLPAGGWLLLLRTIRKCDRFLHKVIE